MPNAGAGAGNLPAIVTLPTAKPGVGRGRHPLDGPALSHPGSRRSFSCATPGLVRGNAHMAYRWPVRAYGQIALSANGQSERWHNDMRHSSGVILIERCGGRKVGTRIRRYSDEERDSSGHPRCCHWPWCWPRIFCRLLPCLRTRAGGLFCETGTPQDANHSMYVR